MMLSNHLLVSAPFSFGLQSFPASESFSESAFGIRWPNYWSFSFNNSPPNEHSGLISFRIDWFHLHAVKELWRVFSSTIIQKHQFFSAQLKNPYVTIRTAIALTIWTFVDKVLLFNTLSRFVITFLPRNKHLWISYLKSPSTVILEPKTVKSVTASIFLLLFAMKWWDWMPWS